MTNTYEKVIRITHRQSAQFVTRKIIQFLHGLRVRWILRSIFDVRHQYMLQDFERETRCFVKSSRRDIHNESDDSLFYHWILMGCQSRLRILIKPKKKGEMYLEASLHQAQSPSFQNILQFSSSMLLQTSRISKPQKKGVLLHTSC